jgi:hypothetical protein
MSRPIQDVRGVGFNLSLTRPYKGRGINDKSSSSTCRNISRTNAMRRDLLRVAASAASNTTGKLSNLAKASGFIHPRHRDLLPGFIRQMRAGGVRP